MLKTALTELTGITHPIVQGPLGYVGGVEIAAATSRAGGLGMIAAATMTAGRMRTAVHEIRDRTDAPFGVNLRGDAEDVGERVAMLVAARVPVVSFARAVSRDLIARLRDAGVVTLASVGARRHAEKAAERGIDAVIVQGAEGGAHVGDVPTALLVAEVVGVVDVPVIAAGGFIDGRGLVAALAQGACGVAMGTRFLLTSDSPLADAVKQIYLDAPAGSTVVTTKVDGVSLRVLRTDLVDSLRPGGADATTLLRMAMAEGRADLGVLACGEAVGRIDDLPSCAELIRRIMAEAERG